MTRQERLKRMDELRRELIKLEVEEDYLAGNLGYGVKEDDLEEITALAYILMGESSSPISNAVDIYKGFSSLTEAGKEAMLKEELRNN